MSKKKIFSTVAFFLTWIILEAQSPDMYPPTVPEPVEKPWIYVAVTLAVIIIFLAYRYSQRKNRKR